MKDWVVVAGVVALLGVGACASSAGGACRPVTSSDFAAYGPAGLTRADRARLLELAAQAQLFGCEESSCRFDTAGLLGPDYVAVVTR